MGRYREGEREGGRERKRWVSEKMGRRDADEMLPRHRQLKRSKSED